MKNIFAKTLLICFASLAINIPLQAKEWEEMTKEEQKNTLEMHKACLNGDIDKVVHFLDEKGVGVKWPSVGLNVPGRGGITSGTAIHYLFFAMQHRKLSDERIIKIADFIIELIKNGADPYEIFERNYGRGFEEKTFLDLYAGAVSINKDLSFGDNDEMKMSRNLIFLDMIPKLIINGAHPSDLCYLGIGKEYPLRNMARTIFMSLEPPFPEYLIEFLLNLDLNCCDLDFLEYPGWKESIEGSAWKNVVSKLKKKVLMGQKCIPMWIASKTKMPPEIGREIASFYNYNALKTTPKPRRKHRKRRLRSDNFEGPICRGSRFCRPQLLLFPLHH